MGAAAAAALQKQPVGRASSNGSLSIPQWMDGLKWTAAPNAFFENVMRVVSGLEAHILGLMLRYTVGDDRRGRPEWTDHVGFSERRLASLTGAHRNGVSLAIERLEKMGAIESERVGQAKRYRVLVRDLATLKGLDSDPAADAAAAEDDEPESDQQLAGGAETDEPIIKMGKHRIALKSIGFCQECAAKVIAAVSSGGGETKANVQPITADSTAPTVADPTEKTEKVNDRRTVGTVNYASHSPSIRLSEDPELIELETHLSRQFAKKLGEAPPRRLTEKAIVDLREAGVPLSDLLARIDARRTVFKYGLLPNLVVDVINAHAAAARSLAPPRSRVTTTETPQISIAEQIRSHATTLIAAYDRVAGAEHVVEALIHVNQNAAALAEDTSKLFEILDNAEIVAAEVAASQVKKFELNRITADAEAFVGPRRSKLTREMLAHEFERYKAPLVLKAAGLPPLGIYLKYA